MQKFERKLIGRRCGQCGGKFDANTLRCPTDNVLLSPEYADPYIGEVIAGKYSVQEFLGEGSWSHVYKASQEGLNRIVAIKFLKFDFIYDDESVRRFRREAVTAGKFSHAGIARVFDHGFLPNGQPYMIMEYLEGENLRDRLARGGALDIFEIVDMIAQMCEALEQAHRGGVLHRDIKPANILIIAGPKGEQVKLLDFGLAKILAADSDKSRALTKTGDVLGTPYYMSPEQAQGQMTIDWRSDIYSLGCVMYEMWTGVVPFDGKNEYEVTYKHVHGDPPKLSEKRPAPPWMEAALSRCLAKDPAVRYQSTIELRKALLSGISTAERAHINKSRLSRQTTPSQTKLSPKAKWIAVAVLVGLLGGGITFFLFNKHTDTDQADSSSITSTTTAATSTAASTTATTISPDNLPGSKTVEELDKRINACKTLKEQIQLAEASRSNLPAESEVWLFQLYKSMDERKSMEYADKILARNFCDKDVVYSLTGGPAISKENPRLCISFLQLRADNYPDLVSLRAASYYCIGELYRRLLEQSKAVEYLSKVADMKDEKAALYKEAALRQLQEIKNGNI